MADTLSKDTRSKLMASIRSFGNRDTELKLVSIFRANGITGWRRKQTLIGKPDFVFRKHLLVVFVDGCFWHGCPKHCRMPKTRVRYWSAKIGANKRRDRLISRQLTAMGWSVLRIWEHSLNNPRRILNRLAKYLPLNVHLTQQRCTN